MVLSGVATVVASQAVITGAFSLTQQAVQLGLLPRMEIRRTSATQAGQIFVPAVNNLLMVGVLVLLFVFQTSHRLASAYGIAVTGAMFVDTLLAYVVVRRMWKWNLLQTGLLLIPLSVVDLVFITSNALKIPEGAWLPLVLGGALVVLMWTWARGSQILADKTRKDSIPLADLVDILKARAPYRAPGTAIFLLGGDAEQAHIAKFAPEIGGEIIDPVDLGGARRDFRLGEAAHLFAHGLRGFSEGEIQPRTHAQIASHDAREVVGG